MAIARVSDAGEITLPAEMLRELGIEPVSSVVVRVQHGEIVIRPVKPVRDLHGVFAEAAKGKPTDWDTIREETYLMIAEEYGREHGIDRDRPAEEAN